MMHTLKQIFTWRMLVVFFMGVSSGFPLALTGSTLQAWMKDAGVDLTTIGAATLIGLPYSLKFLFSPFVDRYTMPLLGRRRGWIVTTQVALAGVLVALAASNPLSNATAFAAIALGVAFFSALQDVVIDAYRREILEENELGLGSALAINGYRIGMVFVGSGLALALAQYMSWQAAYLAMAGCAIFGAAIVAFAPEPTSSPPPRTLGAAFVEPLRDFFSRKGAWMVLAFVLLYKLGDTLASAISTPFYLDIGFEKIDVAVIVKGIGIWATMGGAVLGGVVMLKMGINRSLWVFGIFQALSTLGFAALAAKGADRAWLAAVIGFENLTAGMGTAAYSAYMASLTNKRFTATQYALLTSLMGVPRVILSAPSGFLAKSMGWESYFVFCAALAVPGMLLLFIVAPWRREPAAEAGPEAKSA